MKKVLSTILAVIVSCSLVSSGLVSQGKIEEESMLFYQYLKEHDVPVFAGMEYDAYFAERRVIPSGSSLYNGREYRYQTSKESPSYVNGSSPGIYRQTWFFEDGLKVDIGGPGYEAGHITRMFYDTYPEMSGLGAPVGAIYLDRNKNGHNYPLLLGTGFTGIVETVGHLYAVKDGELRCWDLNTLESVLVFSCSDDENIYLCSSVLDEILFFSAGKTVYRYYRPTDTLEQVFELSWEEDFWRACSNDVIKTSTYTPEYLELMEKAGLAPSDFYGIPKDPIPFYQWLNERYNKNYKIPTPEEVEAADGKWGLSIQSLTMYQLNILDVGDAVYYDLNTGEILDAEYSEALAAELDFSKTEESNLPDIPSPWLGNEMEGAPESLKELLSTVPAGAFWGQDVTSDNVVYTSLGNNQDRVLITALMKSENITRPEKRESLTPEAQAGKTPIPAAKVKAMYESLYGPGTAETLLQREVIGDAIAGDFLLKTEGGDYVYAWAPYAGVTLNSDQVIRYLSHEEKGDTLEVYVSYGLYRYDDGRETYKLFGDARALRYLEFPLTAPLAVGKVGDGTLTDLRDGFLKDLATYKLTFKKDADGYYWAASSLLPANGEIPAPTVSEEPSFPWVPVALTAGLSVVVTGLVAVGIFVPILNRRKKKTTE